MGCVTATRCEQRDGSGGGGARAYPVLVSKQQPGDLLARGGHRSAVARGAQRGDVLLRDRVLRRLQALDQGLRVQHERRHSLRLDAHYLYRVLRARGASRQRECRRGALARARAPARATLPRARAGGGARARTPALPGARAHPRPRRCWCYITACARGPTPTTPPAAGPRDERARAATTQDDVLEGAARALEAEAQHDEADYAAVIELESKRRRM